MTNNVVQKASQTDKHVFSLISTSRVVEEVFLRVSAADAGPAWMYRGKKHILGVAYTCLHIHSRHIVDFDLRVCYMGPSTFVVWTIINVWNCVVSCLLIINVCCVVLLSCFSPLLYGR